MNTHTSIIEQTLNATRALINRSAFEEVLDDFFYGVDLMNQRRICKWLDFFNQHYYRNPCVYEYTVYALFEAIGKNELFKLQSEYEFEISTAFYEKILKSKTFISIENTEEATHLLVISLVLGKYPGMQIRSLHKAIELLSGILDERKLNTFFAYIFVKYENPVILTCNLTRLDLIEIDMLMFILQGNNIRNHPDFPKDISKKEAHIFINEIPALKFYDNLILRSIVTTKIILATKNSNFIQQFYSNSKIFRFKINTFYNDIDFWCEVYLFLMNVDWGAIDKPTADFIDYFEYMKYDSNEGLILKGRSVKSVCRDIENWHENTYFVRQKEHIHLSWKGIDTKEYKIEFNGDQYLFKEITNGEDLYRESDEMKHCVFSYIDLCVERYCSIWSMQKELNTTFKNYLTIEVREKEIVQVSGKKNKIPTEKDEQIIKDWAKEAGIEYVLTS